MLAHLEADLSARLLRSVRPWLKPTPQQVRNAVLGLRMIVSSHGHNDKQSEFLATTNEAFVGAIASGRLICVGHLPNEAIKTLGGQGAQLFGHGHIKHPFAAPYCIFHTWEQGGSILLVDPFDFHVQSRERLPEGTFLVVEAQPVMVAGEPSLLLAAGAFATLDPVSCRYGGEIILSGIYQGNGMDGLKLSLELLPSMLDPTMAALLLLNTDGIEATQWQPGEKLNRARVKNGNAPLPPHWEVNTGPYITALLARRQRGPRSASQGGHHASPIPHIRRGHVRHLDEVRTTWVHDCLINLTDPDAPVARSFYSLRREEAASR
jgi:hypothetical protein